MEKIGIYIHIPFCKKKCDYCDFVSFSGIITSLEAKNYIYDIDFNERGIIVIGNESKGVSSGIQSIADEKYKIPMIGKTESLNAAVATSIIAYEKVRRLVK